MSLSILASKASKGRHPQLVPSDWTERLEGPGDLAIRYTHTTRVAPSMIDLDGSDETSILASTGPRIFSHTPTDGGETLPSFSGNELFWNNRFRCHAIMNGIDKFVPQILYLIRPETAFTSCLHFLAKEIGGIQGYEDQRQFIIRNPGLTTLMPKFWQKVQVASWSGGFALPKEEVALLLLALLECFVLSPHDPDSGPKEAFPCPHLPLPLLHEAGIFLPSIEHPEPIPTAQAHALLTDTLSRANLPGTPTDLTSYIECFVCGSHTAPVGESNRHKCIPLDQLKCTGCGLVFPNHDEYRIHCLSFCRMGPTSQGRCGCCNTKGPQCLCQQHWRKTYALIASSIQGNITRTDWLTPEYIPLLIDAGVFLGWDLVPTSPTQAGTTPSPVRLRDSLWDPTVAPLPRCVVSDGESLFLPHGGTEPASPETIRRELESALDIDIKRLATVLGPLEVKPPSSTSKAATDASMRVYRERHIGVSGITIENATANDLSTLSRKIDITTEKLSKPKSAQMLSIALQMPVKELEDQVQQLQDLRAAIAANMDHEWTSSKRLSFGGDDNDSDSVPGSNIGSRKGPPSSNHSSSDKKEFRPPIPIEDSADGPFYCRNESHHQEKPPYRVFDTMGAKTAHLSRSHFCPYKRNFPPCPFFYEMEVELGNHLIKTHPRPKLTDQCPVCDTLVDKEHLEIHMQSVHSECTNCRTWFKDLEALKTHWDSHGGACEVATVEDEPVTRHPPAPPLPRSLTLASLPDLKSGHEGLLTEALSIILDTAIPADNEAAKERAKDLITSYTFHQNHQRNISRNPYKALSECKPFLEIPCFKHPPNSKEKSFDKALDSAQVVELSPYTSERFSNYLKMEGLHSKMLNYIKQYNLTEPSATYLLLNHLSPENVDVLRASYRRHPYELSYLEVTKTLQMRFYNLDLKSLRDSVGNLRRGNNEHHVTFHTRCFKLCNLAAINFTESQKAIWVESKVREIFYKSLDANLRMEVDEMESRHGITMSSTELLETYVCRANLKSTIDVGEDTLMSVARVSESKPSRRPRRVNMILSPGPNTSATTDSRQNRSARPGQAPGRPNPSAPQGQARAPTIPGTRPGRGLPEPGTRSPNTSHHRQSPRPLLPGPRDRLRGPLAGSRETPDRGPPIAPRRDRDTSASRPPGRGPSAGNPFRPGTRLADKHNSIVETLRAMGTDLRSLERDGTFCWSCGAGRPSLSQQPYHPRKQCSLPMYHGPAHECAPGIKLMHEPAMCPRRRQRISVVRMED